MDTIAINNYLNNVTNIWAYTDDTDDIIQDKINELIELTYKNSSTPILEDLASLQEVVYILSTYDYDQAIAYLSECTDFNDLVFNQKDMTSAKKSLKLEITELCTTTGFSNSLAKCPKCKKDTLMIRRVQSRSADEATGILQKCTNTSCNFGSKE